MLMSIKDVSEYLGMHEMTIYKLAWEGKIPCFKVGGQWRFQKDALEMWLNTEMKGKTVEQINNRKDIHKVVIIGKGKQPEKSFIRKLEETDFTLSFHSAVIGNKEIEKLMELNPDAALIFLSLPDIEVSELMEFIRMNEKLRHMKTIMLIERDTQDTKERVLPSQRNR